VFPEVIRNVSVPVVPRDRLRTSAHWPFTPELETDPKKTLEPVFEADHQRQPPTCLREYSCLSLPVHAPVRSI
jgi:hypothetical protein